METEKASSTAVIEVPPGFKLHTENTSHILLPDNNEAFLNPVQEFNRDLSVACIRTWAAERAKLQESKWLQRQVQPRAGNGQSKKRRKGGDRGEETEIPPVENAAEGPSQSSQLKQFKSREITILEALSATGLRSIRYAKEIPDVKYVIANDLSPAAAEAIRRNVIINGLGPEKKNLGASELFAKEGKVRVNEGDACALMYSHRDPQARVDVVDLDPYGTAAPFIDGAVQSVRDGGLLCVTCTDMSVLAGINYPEKCFANYGGIPIKGEYCHESALRLVLHTIAISAARYGRFITPLISLSIDFYVRLFVQVNTGALEVKRLASQTANYYVCTICQSPYEQPLGKVVTKDNPKDPKNPGHSYKSHAAPTVGSRCPECDSALHLAGPMWSGPLHDKDFVKAVLQHTDDCADKYGTSTRMKGMLTVACEELDVPFYFTPSKIAGLFHCECPSLDEMASALLNGGYKISRSHAFPGSLKTNAPRSFIHDVMRGWVKKHPVKMENIKEGQVARRLLAKELSTEINFTRHTDSVTRASAVKLVRYQVNPAPNWGPAKRAVGKRKREEE